MPDQVTCVTLGRLGDLLCLLPAFRLIAHRTGKPVKVVVSERFSHVLEGASFVEPIRVGYDWITGIAEAKREHPDAVIPQAWLDPDAPEFSVEPSPLLTPLTINGRTLYVDMRKDSAYDVLMWRRLGFTRQKMLTTPLILDQRSPERESEAVSPYLRANKPLLLVNLVSPSSPFTFLPEVVAVLLKLSKQFLLVDLSKIRCHRIFDMLGIMERAAGMVHCDTSTLHLSAAVRTPYVAFTADGWRGSTPRGNCILNVRYSDAMNRLDEVAEAVRGFGTGRLVATERPALAQH